MKYGSLDIRMKKYEYVTRTYLVRTTPLIITTNNFVLERPIECESCHTCRKEEQGS